MGKLTEEVKDTLVSLYEDNFTNRQIAEKLGVHHTTVGNWLKKLELENKFCKQKVDIISPTKARCSKCGEIKNLSEFQHGRKDSDREYTFSYCKECRKKQSYLNLNSSPEKFLKNAFNKLKLRADKNNILFDIDYEYVLEVFNLQEGLCFYTGNKMVLKVGEGLNNNSLSFDKIIPEKGYTKGNVVLCSNRFNIIKNNLSLYELQNYIPKFYEKIINCK